MKWWPSRLLQNVEWDIGNKSQIWTTHMYLCQGWIFLHWFDEIRLPVLPLWCCDGDFSRFNANTRKIHECDQRRETDMSLQHMPRYAYASNNKSHHIQWNTYHDRRLIVTFLRHARTPCWPDMEIPTTTPQSANCRYSAINITSNSPSRSYRHHCRMRPIVTGVPRCAPRSVCLS